MLWDSDNGRNGHMSHCFFISTLERHRRAQQVSAVYQTFLAIKALTWPAEIVVKTTYPIGGWVHDVATKSSLAQCFTLAKCNADLLQHSKPSTSLLSHKLQQVLGSVL